MSADNNLWLVRCDELFVWGAQAAILSFDCTRSCVRQAAGYDRLAACAPRISFAWGFLHALKQWQWPTFLLPSGGSQRHAYAQPLHPATPSFIMLIPHHLRSAQGRGLLA